MINEEVLLKNGYKEYDVPQNTEFDKVLYRNCDKFYQKILSKEPVSTINVYYYDKFKKEDGSLDYDYEFEWVRECYLRWEKKLIYGLDKEITLEEVERLLLGE